MIPEILPDTATFMGSNPSREAWTAGSVSNPAFSKPFLSANDMFREPTATLGYGGPGVTAPADRKGAQYVVGVSCIRAKGQHACCSLRCHRAAPCVELGVAGLSVGAVLIGS